MNQSIICGNNINVLKTFADNSVDSVVTDPPYGLSFMNKHWDYEVPSIELWVEVLRVLKPGGHLLSFGGTRTYHRMVVNIEDAGFEIRDQIQWLYGSGFPKSMDVSKAIDKQAGFEREVVGERLTGAAGSRADKRNSNEGFESGNAIIDITAPATDEAKQWDGWGTALKPANEPIVLARKPISEPTIAANILKWGTGGINIDGCRIGFTSEKDKKSATFGTGIDITGGNFAGGSATQTAVKNIEANDLGRFPANIILDEVAAEMLDEQSGVSKSTGGSGEKSMGALGKNGKYGTYALDVKSESAGGFGDKGGASRFFYVAKPDNDERSRGLGRRETQTVNDGRDKPIDNAFQRGTTKRKNIHPTVKPIDLMRYLIRLVTPPDGIVLDPFNGSGTTGIAAKEEFKNYIGIEIDSEYVEISEARLKACNPQMKLL